MAAHHDRIALISAEGGPFDMMAGRYSKFPPLEVYLKGHAGDHLRVDRTGRAAEFIESPALTICVCFQPAILATLAAREGFRTRGLLARFLFSVPDSFVGRRKIGEPPIEPEIADRYARDLQALVLSLAEWTDPAVLTFSPEANAALLEFERDLEPRLAPDGTLGDIADWGSKLAGAVVRIAGLLHLATSLKTGWRDPIADDTVGAAIEIGNYFLDHAIAAHKVMGAGSALGAARVLLDWLHRTRPSSFSRRDAHRARQSHFARADDLDPALDLLEAHGWIRRRPTLAPGPQGGRPSAPVWDVHPDIFDDTTSTS